MKFCAEWRGDRGRRRGKGRKRSRLLFFAGGRQRATRSLASESTRFLSLSLLFFVISPASFLPVSLAIGPRSTARVEDLDVPRALPRKPRGHRRAIAMQTPCEESALIETKAKKKRQKEKLSPSSHPINSPPLPDVRVPDFGSPLAPRPLPHAAIGLVRSLRHDLCGRDAR